MLRKNSTDGIDPSFECSVFAVCSRGFVATDSIVISTNVEARSFWQGAVVVLGRFLFALIFLMAGANNFSKQTIGYAASQGVPMASILVPLSGALAVAGGLSILLQNSAPGSSRSSWFRSP